MMRANRRPGRPTHYCPPNGAGLCCPRSDSPTCLLIICQLSDSLPRIVYVPLPVYPLPPQCYLWSYPRCRLSCQRETQLLDEVQSYAMRGRVERTADRVRVSCAPNAI